MCTALNFVKNRHYFGRNLDVEFSYGESIALSPRNFPLAFSDGTRADSHPAIMGVAHVAEGYPLYFDAINEHGLCVAALNFPLFAHYHAPCKSGVNIAPYELIPRILCACKSVEEAKRLLSSATVCNLTFGENYPNTTLHWIIADESGAIVAESVKDGLKIYDNPVGVLTNSPTFDMQLYALNDYMSLSPNPPQNNFSPSLALKAYSRGMGALGLPGDFSSKSRFVRAVFTHENSVCDSEKEELAQFFRILDGVAQPKGCVNLGGKYEYTVYTDAYDVKNLVCYYKTYFGTALSAVDMKAEDRDGATLVNYPIKVTDSVIYDNLK